MALSPVAAAQLGAQAMVAPVARTVPKADTMFGDVRVDNYFWLRHRDDPAVIDYLQAENRYTQAVMAPSEALQKALYDEMLSHIKETDLSVPERRGEYLYYSRTEKGKQYPILCRRRGSMSAPEQVMLDQNALGAKKKYFRVASWRVSPDGRYLAFLTDTLGSERFTLNVKDLTSGSVAPARVDSVSFSLEWAGDNRTIFYAKGDSANRAHRVYRWVRDTPASTSVLVAEEPDLLYSIDVSKTKDNRFLLLSSYSYDNGETRVVPASDPTATPRMIRARSGKIEYSVDHHGKDFVILTNENALNFRIATVPDSTPGAAWTELVGPSDSVLIDGIDVFRDQLVLYERGQGTQRIRVRDFASGTSHDIPFEEPVYAVFGTANPDYESHLLRYTYSSPITPASVYDYDMTHRTRTLLKRTEVPGFDPSRYETARVWATASDGARIPISLLWRKPLQRDGKRPMMLTGYGAYGLSSDPSFSSSIFSLVDRGYVYAIAHIRGGEEMGRQWYEDGRLLHKRNTFTDFIASAEYLEKNGYTSADRLAIRGGSAGGLLMGAVVTMRPELFKAVIADVPFVDVVNTMRDASIPLTANEWIQWGNPNDSTYYGYMKSYAPYENVQHRAYPSMLVTAGLDDPRVPYWEPAKFVAKLRAMKTDTNPLLLRTNMSAGHFGASGRYDYLREQAIRYAFVINAVGDSLRTLTP